MQKWPLPEHALRAVLCVTQHNLQRCPRLHLAIGRCPVRCLGAPAVALCRSLRARGPLLGVVAGVLLLVT
jgi:ABC-type transport system involved in cytochrome c biogenesis permease component